MDLQLFYEQDADLSVLNNKRVAVLGYGSQGHAHALNLRDSGVDVAVGLRAGSPSRAKAGAMGLACLEIADAVQWADVVMVLMPEESHKAVFEESIKPHLKAGKALAFAHGFSVHFGQVQPPADVDVFMVAPKGPGHTVRREYERGSGVPSLVAVHQNASGDARTLALAYAKALGATRAGVAETTFKEETETDLFGEQAVLCGGLTRLIQAGFETLVEAGYSPAMAYFECLHEMKLIVDLIWEGGLSAMRFSISNTAEYGDYACGNQVIDNAVKQRMKKMLADVQNGNFARQWIQEFESGCKTLLRQREEHKLHLIEQVGRDLRERMRFPQQKKLVEVAQS